jgi:2-oxoglutarate ferredoxin oxidoreductase subunit beta
MDPPTYPKAVGVLYCDPAPSYDDAVHKQIAEVTAKTPPIEINKLLRRGQTWNVQ